MASATNAKQPEAAGQRADEPPMHIRAWENFKRNTIGCVPRLAVVRKP